MYTLFEVQALRFDILVGRQWSWREWSGLGLIRLSLIDPSWYHWDCHSGEKGKFEAMHILGFNWKGSSFAKYI